MPIVVSLKIPVDTPAIRGFADVFSRICKDTVNGFNGPEWAYHDRADSSGEGNAYHQAPDPYWE